MKKLIFFLLLTYFLTPTVMAATAATPSAAPTATVSATPSQSQDIQEKIKNLVKENLSATESTLKEKINQRTLVGYVGTIQSINSGNLTIISREDTLQITTNEKTSYVKSGSPVKITSLALTDKIIVIGILLKEDIILAKRIVVVVEDTDVVTSGTLVAKVTSVDIKKKLIGLIVGNVEVLHGLTKRSTIKIGDITPGVTIFAITKKYQGNDLLSRAKIL